MSDANLRPADRPNDLIVFDHCNPVHDAGTKLTVEVGQTVPGRLQTSGKVHLEVQGPQIALQPQDVLGVYPAAGSEDSPVDFLPHVVLSRRTLPWERSGPIAASPWLLLLLIDDSELPSGAGPRATKVSEIAKVDATAYQRMHVKLGLADDTPITVVDLPRALIQRIRPTQPDLNLLVHMRRLISDSPLRQLDDDGDVAVVIGNRLPNADGANLQHAFLVSIEGRDDLWDDSLAQAPAQAPAQPAATKIDPLAARRVVGRMESIRVQPAAQIGPVVAKRPVIDLLKQAAATSLIVLHHWTFSTATGGDFEAVIKAIRFRPNGGVLRFGNLPRSRADAPLTSMTDAQGHLKDNLDYPQVPGGEAIYRGALLPRAPAARKDVYALRARPDEFIGAGAPTGAIERSELIAFELGRLLALADEGVLSAMQQIQPKLVPPDLPEHLAIDPRPPALRFPETVINPDPTVWEQVVHKWIGIDKTTLFDKQKLGTHKTDLGGLQQLIDRQPQMIPNLRNQLAKLAQIDIGQIEVGQIDIGSLDVEILDKQFPGLIHAARG
jgi:hypothetical protein